MIENPNPWIVWNVGFDVNHPPKSALIIAYGYNDETGTEHVGYVHELRQKIKDKTIVWKYTGIARETLQ
jgi:hypothetical protein